MTVFDPKVVIDRSTYLEPFQYSAGIVHVVVNGRLWSPANTAALGTRSRTARRTGPARRRGTRRVDRGK